MSFDERVQHILRAAERAEQEGNERVARSLRRMAADFSSPAVGLCRD